MFPFNVRVYGLLINEQKQVLVADEMIKGKLYTKFPGGGLEFGEGTRECLAREFLEEMSLKVEVTDHLYTTDFFQLSAFSPGHQIISIYYLVEALEPIRVRLSTEIHQFDEDQLEQYKRNEQIESFRFISWDNLTEDCMTLPIDKVAVSELKNRFNHFSWP
ncbi:MAG TPA: NUDIX domain-containing protein [Flavisolibacter sp.]|nr:NUDIX domain-containing protein [Flavisolibacter sp.]